MRLALAGFVICNQDTQLFVSNVSYNSTPEWSDVPTVYRTVGGAKRVLTTTGIVRKASNGSTAATKSIVIVDLSTMEPVKYDLTAALAKRIAKCQAARLSLLTV